MGIAKVGNTIAVAQSALKVASGIAEVAPKVAPVAKKAAAASANKVAQVAGKAKDAASRSRGGSAYGAMKAVRDKKAKTGSVTSFQPAAGVPSPLAVKRLKTIFRRCSVRSYTDDPVTADQVEEILKGGMAAPSACNQQPWEFYVVRDGDLRVALAQASPYCKACGEAPVVIVPCMKKKGLPCPAFVPQDMGAAVENILLAATAMGLGSLWMGIYPDQERMDEVSRILALPEELEPFALVAIGRAAGEVEPTGASRFDADRIHVLEG